MSGDFRRRIKSAAGNENFVLGGTAILVGVVAGFGAVAFQLVLDLVGRGLLGGEGVATGSLIRTAIAPAIGGLIAGPLIVRGAREAKGHGVPEVMEAVALRGGRIRGRVAIVKIVASAFTIGSGGSAGREGPIVQTGAALGSQMGQWFRMTEPRLRILVGCGAAGGVAAAFNAPLAGMFFALEVILQRFTARGVAAVALSAVTGSVVWRSVFGNQPVLNVPAFGLRNPVELVFYLVLGLLAAVVAAAFVRTLYWFDDRFEGLRMPEELKPALGGVLLGAVGVGLVMLAGEPLVYGNGLRGMNLALDGGLFWWVMLILIAAKMVATSLSLGSGASGGVFAPTLFVGAMLGGVVGQAVHTLLPQATAQPGAYTMVGMAAVFAAAAQAPISAILILFEMTNDYLIILPLMLSCVVGTFAYTLIETESIYSAKLKRRGVEIVGGRERALMERIPIARAVVTEFPSLKISEGPESAQRVLLDTGNEYAVVLDEGGRLVGTVNAQRVAEALQEEVAPLLQSVLDEPAVVTPWESLEAAFAKMAPRGLRVLPVVDGPRSNRVIGVVTRDTLLGAYYNALVAEQPQDPTP